MEVTNTGCGDSMTIFINGNEVNPAPPPPIPSESIFIVGSTNYPLELIDGVALDTALIDTQTATLRFGVTAAPAPMCSGSGTFTPTLLIDGRDNVGGRYAEAYSSPGDPFAETVTVTGTSGPCIQIYDWREAR